MNPQSHWPEQSRSERNAQGFKASNLFLFRIISRPFVDSVFSSPSLGQKSMRESPTKSSRKTEKTLNKCAVKLKNYT